MTIFVVILLTASCIFIGKRSTGMGMKEYMIIFIITVLQVAYFIAVFYTMEQPAGF